MNRPTQLLIDTEAIKTNLKNMRAHTPESLAVYAVVKADGYGHGALPVAQAAIESGVVDGFCVATIDEGIELREAGITQPILILGLVETSHLALVSDFDLAIPVAMNDWLEEALAVYHEQAWSRPVKVHLAVETGMGRIGFVTKEELQLAESTIRHTNAFELEGVFSHFATADEADDTYWHEQKDRFFELISGLSKQPKYCHLENSATNIWHEPLGNIVRYGIAMYGLNPSGDELALRYPLQPALSLESKVMQVKKLPKGAGIGYGHTYVTSDEEWIATIPIGYADGYVRRLQGFHVLIEGEYCPIVGRICMDQLMVRVPRQIERGTKVTLVGKNQDKSITLQDIAAYIGTIHYEVACLFTQRLPRIYH